MTNLMRRMPRSLQLALGALCLAALFAGVSLANAFRVTPIEPTVDESEPSASAQAPVQSGSTLSRAVAIDAAIAKDPFSETRSRPAQRYRLPGEVVETAAPQAARGPALRIQGVMTFTGDSTKNVVMAQLGNSNLPPRRLKVGDVIGQYTLKRIDAKTSSAYFQSASGEELVFRPSIQTTTPR